MTDNDLPLAFDFDALAGRNSLAHHKRRTTVESGHHKNADEEPETAPVHGAFAGAIVEQFLLPPSASGRAPAGRTEKQENGAPEAGWVRQSVLHDC